MVLSGENPLEGFIVGTHHEQHVGLGVHEVAFIGGQFVGSGAAFQGALQPFCCGFNVFAGGQKVGVIVQHNRVFNGTDAPFKRFFREVQFAGVSVGPSELRCHGSFEHGVVKQHVQARFERLH